MDRDDDTPFTSEDKSAAQKAAELVDQAKKKVFGDPDVSQAHDDEMQRPPEDRSPLSGSGPARN